MVSGEDVPKKTNPKVWWLLFDHLGNGPNSWWVCLGTSIFSLFSLCAYVAYYDWRPHATWFDTISSIFWYEKQIPLHVSRNWYLDKNISWPLHRPKTRWPTTAGSQEPDPAETFVVVKGESSRVPNGCRCVLCGKTVDVMRDHDAWAWRHQNFSGPLSYKLVINPVYYSYII